MSTDAMVGQDVAAGSNGSPAAVRTLRVRVVEVIDETADARSFVLTPTLNAGLPAGSFSYRAGQFLTVRVPNVGTGSARCYSLASSPDADTAMKITVKRVDGGHGSNWLCDSVGPGNELEVLPPAGAFTPRSVDDSVVLVAGGSGITPVIGIAKSILHAGTGEVTLIYANRDEASVIFAGELRALEERFRDRFTVVHILESVQGYPSRQLLAVLLRPFTQRAVYICGPTPLMDLTAEVCAAVGFPSAQVRSERFLSLRNDPFTEVPDPDADEPDAADVVADIQVILDGDERRVPWRTGRKLLDALLAAGLEAPYSCREGACSACVCSLTFGQVRMARNEVLTEEDLAEGYILACQAEPVSEEVSIEY